MTPKFLVVLLAFACLAHACKHEPTSASAPVACTTTERIHVVGHGWHAGLVVRRDDLVRLIPALAADLPGAEHLEIGWGDEDFYQAAQGTLGLAVRALFRSASSALQVVAFSGSPRTHFPESESVELCADEAAYRSVIAFVAQTFKRDPDGNIIRLGPSQYGRGWFYRAEGAFHMRNTCNTWVAKGLTQAGYPISSDLVRAEELLSQLRPLSAL